LQYAGQKARAECVSIKIKHGRTTEVMTANNLRWVNYFLTACLLVMGFASLARADDAKKPIDVKATFRTICSYCHQDMGRKPGKAPQLMNSERSDEFIFNRIKNGKPGQMAAFGGSFSDDDIRRIIVFIRSLKADEEPQNPS
jgi:mono/diheme cytochrome c family protein